ncbi:GNAT family N-acetyltransferase [Paenibacillus albiflavus]|uniref:GNAT family N-acetyltransferase n=1 Tax=Paenibacillus albiflavus TaxID=2545760 RepID=A0A4R4EKW8_9BACL|nr:GNAT family N-acetyltransferase [Paenibacillus albiflavus]TCZ80876.1 GNAT family N-acetyltransferase [Paenibacillus albiflavus]
MDSIDLNDSELMNIQASTLYVLNEDSRIIRINERTSISPPAIFIGKTKSSTYTYFRHDIPQFVIDEVNAYTSDSIPIIELCRVMEKYHNVTNLWIGPAYRFKQVEIMGVDSSITLIDVSNKHLLIKYYGHLITELEDRAPIVAYIVNEEAVSVCCCARKTRRAAEASLNTAEPFRGQGIAQKVVHHWGNEIFRLRLIPIYSTSWDNLSSQQVAQKLGLVQFGMNYSIST